MAPLLPSESSAYTVTLPDKSEDDRFNLNIRTGAASTYTKSTIVVHGGFTVGLPLPSITIPEIELKLEELGESDWDKLISNEIFFLNIITRQWARLEVDPSKDRPQPRAFHSITFHENSIYLFGGLVYDKEENQLVPTNDLWEFNTVVKEWICIDNGLRSGAVNRYDSTLLKTDYISPDDDKSYPALVIAGGRSDLNQELNHITVYDLEKKIYVNNSQMNLNLNELLPTRNNSSSTDIDPRTIKEADKSKLTATSDTNFIISGSSNTENTNSLDDNLFVYATKHNTEFSNPLVSLPTTPNGSGLRLELSHTLSRNSNAVPGDLRFPSGGIFGSNVIVSGNSPNKNEYQVFSFNRPSKKWTKLNIDSKKKATEIYLWKCFSWASHHKVLLLGSAVVPKDLAFPTVQHFDLMVTVGLPITNIYHGSTVPQIGTRRGETRSGTMKENTSFEAYSKYAAPSTKISSIKSVFPNFAVALGRNAFERYGSSLADFEFISADGEKVNVPIMLLRKRWGRCFDMLLAKAYSRAVYQLENQASESNDTSETNSVTSGSVSGGAAFNKKSMMVFNKNSSTSRNEKDIPKFRTPFQESRSTPPTSAQQSLAPNSRKASVVSQTSNMSARTDSTSEDRHSLTPNLNFSNLPPQPAMPTEPLPSIERSPRGSTAPTPLTPLNRGGQVASSFASSPRGSVSGAPGSPAPLTSSTSRSRLKEEVKTPVQNFKKRDNSRSSSVQSGRGVDDTTSIPDNQSTVDSLNQGETEEDNKQLLEPLLTPRSLYLPFATSTVQALAEFLFTGQLGDKWLLQPTTLDSFLIAKFYEIPLLYDLISEVLYASIGKKEESLIKDYGIFVANYQNQLKTIFREDEFKINSFFEDHPYVRKVFVEMEGYLNTVDDGYLNVTLLRKASKASTFFDDDNSIFKNPSSGKRRSSTRSKFGKSSLSKEVNVDEPEDDDIDNENEEEDEEEPQQLLTEVSTKREKIKFNEDSMSSKSAKKVSSNSDYDDIDPITPLTATHSQQQSELKSKKSQETNRSDFVDAKDNSDKSDILSQYRSTTDDESIDPLTKIESHISKISSSNKTESDNEIQVPEGRFHVKKNDLERVKTGESTSSHNDQKASSDDDDVGVGIGLLDGNQLGDSKSKKTSEAEFDAPPIDANLPTLEFLASPDSPAPTDQLIQVIYEVSALACDMKLLLRAANALEMSKVFTEKKAELQKDLDEYGLQHEELRLKEELVLREAEEVERKKREDESAAKQKEIDLAMAKIEVEKKRLQEAKQKEAQAREEEARLKQQQELETPQRQQSQSKQPRRTESSGNLLGKAFKADNDEDSLTSGKSRGTGLRSAFQTFRSFSSISLNNMNTGRRMSPFGTNSGSGNASESESEIFSSTNNTAPRQHSGTSPVKNPNPPSRSSSSSGGSKYKNIFSAILPKRSQTSRQ